MSFQALNWIVGLKLGSPKYKSIMLVLANYADEIAECFPSQKTISNQTEYCLRSVKQGIKDLQAIGIISTTKQYRKNGSEKSLRYRLNMSMSQVEYDSSLEKYKADKSHFYGGAADAPHEGDSIGGAADAPGGCSRCTGGGAADAPLEPSIITTKDTQNARTREAGPDGPVAGAEAPVCLDNFLKDWFDEFWRAYPRQDDRNLAKKAFEKFMKEESENLDHDQTVHDIMDSLMDAVRNYGEKIRKEGIAERYVKKAHNWLVSGDTSISDTNPNKNLNSPLEAFHANAEDNSQQWNAWMEYYQEFEPTMYKLYKNKPTHTFPCEWPDNYASHKRDAINKKKIKSR